MFFLETRDSIFSSESRTEAHLSLSTFIKKNKKNKLSIFATHMDSDWNYATASASSSSSPKKKKKSSSKRSSTPSVLKKKPVKTRCGYNFFYKAQRKILLESYSKQNPHLSEKVNKFIDVEENGKRRQDHKKTHGIIHLEDLTKIIAKLWNEASPSVKKIYNDEAERDKIRYKNEMEVHLKEQENVKSNNEGEAAAKDTSESSTSTSKNIEKVSAKKENENKEDTLITPVPFESISDNSINDLMADKSTRELLDSFRSGSFSTS